MNNGEQKAFPLEYGTSDGRVYQKGLTKREYFAGLAMQGFCANVNALMSLKEHDIENDIANAAISTADALLEKLNETTP